VVSLVTLRRKLSRLLAVWAVRVDPDPPFTITTTRIDVGYPDLALVDALRYSAPSGTEHRY
jgi:hypothetical protein